MSDRELLEMAAKAAGIDLLWSSEDEVSPRLADNQFWPWNPLISDGDALRLAVTLAKDGKLRIQVTGDDVTAFQHWDGVWVPITWTFDVASPSEAFRRAIVRAAAEIGRAKP